MTNFEKIKDMSVEELSELLRDTYNDGWFDGSYDQFKSILDYTDWLESEVEK